MRRSLSSFFACGLLAAALWSIAPASSIAAPAPPEDSVEMLAEPMAPPDIAYLRADGDEGMLSDFKGKVVVLNFWATWCAPCVRELPSLDRLAGLLPGDAFKVLTLSTDRGGPEKAAAFLEKHGATRLGADMDPRTKLGRALGLRGMPTTFVIDRDGRIVAKLAGIAEWDSPEYVDWLKAIQAQ